MAERFKYPVPSELSSGNYMGGEARIPTFGEVLANRLIGAVQQSQAARQQSERERIALLREAALQNYIGTQNLARQKQLAEYSLGLEEASRGRKQQQDYDMLTNVFTKAGLSPEQAAGAAARLMYLQGNVASIPMANLEAESKTRGGGAGGTKPGDIDKAMRLYDNNLLIIQGVNARFRDRELTQALDELNNAGNPANAIELYTKIRATWPEAKNYAETIFNNWYSGYGYKQTIPQYRDVPKYETQSQNKWQPMQRSSPSGKTGGGVKLAD